MKSKAVEDFIKYAREEFGYNIVLDSSSEPDSFESIFGCSFIQSDISVDIEDVFYENSFLNVKFSVENDVNFMNIGDRDLAA